MFRCVGRTDVDHQAGDRDDRIVRSEHCGAQLVGAVALVTLAMVVRYHDHSLLDWFCFVLVSRSSLMVLGCCLFSLSVLVGILCLVVGWEFVIRAAVGEVLLLWMWWLDLLLVRCMVLAMHHVIVEVNMHRFTLLVVVVVVRFVVGCFGIVGYLVGVLSGGGGFDFVYVVFGV